MTLPEQLHRLQRLDQEIDTKERRLADVQRALQDDRTLREAEKRLTLAETEARTKAVRQTDLELELQSLTEKVERESVRLYGGSIRNPKELQDLQDEVASLGRRRGRTEDNVLQAMIESEEAEAALSAAHRRLETESTAFAARQASLSTELGELRESIAALERERAAVASTIGAGDLANYEALRKRKGGLAVTRVVGDACAACGVTISRNRRWHLREGDVVHCANCERIVVLA